MKSLIAKAVTAAIVFASVIPAAGQSRIGTPQATATEKSSLVERIGSTGVIQLEAASFTSLSPKQRILSYYLSQAAIAVDPIIYDQLSQYGLYQKRILEGIVSHPQGIDERSFKQISDYTKLFWANAGNHNSYTAQKFLPEFTRSQLEAAAQQAIRNGFRMTPAELKEELSELDRSFFDPAFEPMTTAKSPQGGLDILQASSNNFYKDVTLNELKDFHESYPLNSRLVSGPDMTRARPAAGPPGTKLVEAPIVLVEQIYRAGTPDGRIPPGLYATYLKKANEFLEQAKPYAEPGQAAVIDALIRYYQTGDPKDWIRVGELWVQNKVTVDFSNGFVEVYHDARGAKGAIQGFVTITDESVNRLMLKIADNAQYFENRAPWADKYKKQGVKPPLAVAVEAVAETGDFSVTTVGDNLPNENEIHEKYGTKSFLFTGSSRALDHATGTRAIDEFAATPEEATIVKKYGDEAENLLTALHEIIGHGSGKLSPSLSHEPQFYLKEYYSTLEEARADLMALWNVWDPKLQELGLISNPDVAKAMYYSSARVALTQLRSTTKGDQIEEDHQRNRQLIVNYIMDKTGAIKMEERDGKHYIVITDFQKMRQGVGQLLAELMRIKGEGDYEAIKALIDKYAVHFDPKVRDEVVARYSKLDLPTYWAGINPQIELVRGAGGKVTGAKITYPHNFVAQRLLYASMYE